MLDTAPLTARQLAREIADLMQTEHPEPTDADWTVCHSTEDQSAAVVFQPRPTFGSRPQVRARYLWQWEATLEDAGYTVEERRDGPAGTDELAPWWLRIPLQDGTDHGVLLDGDPYDMPASYEPHELAADVLAASEDGSR